MLFFTIEIRSEGGATAQSHCTLVVGQNFSRLSARAGSLTHFQFPPTIGLRPIFLCLSVLNESRCCHDWDAASGTVITDRVKSRLLVTLSSRERGKVADQADTAYVKRKSSPERFSSSGKEEERYSAACQLGDSER
jgi:hypothetical protein